MEADRRGVALGLAAAFAAAPALLRAAPAADASAEVLRGWWRLILELTRHTPTYSPPVASRAFALIALSAHEAAAGGALGLRSLAGRLPELTPPPPRPADPPPEAAVLHGALAASVAALFANTGPTGQRAMAAMTRRLGAAAAAGADPAAAARAEGHGRAVAAHVLGWAAGDGGAVVENLGFPQSWPAPAAPGAWVPTSRIALQQAPLLPGWGANRPFALPDAEACPAAPPPPYSENPASAFFAEAREVHALTRALTAEQIAIARFWSDDPMLSPTPPGHWIAIALACLADRGAGVADHLDALTRLSVAMADAFIACWRDKYRHDLLRPVTFIRRHIDPAWEPLLITPPFPEFPSGHSVQSGAAAAVLTALFGEGFAFADRTHEEDGMAARAFPSFAAAAREAALSRLYGGIHFRSAVEHGLAQGACVGAHAAALPTRA
jgi:membrane-associated phospholipid phosphatase